MKRTLTMMMLCCMTIGMQAANPKKVQKSEPEMEAYLMVYHKDADHGLHMALSSDGYTWTALNDDKPVIAGDTIAEQRGIRDPHIFRGPDGAFYPPFAKALARTRYTMPTSTTNTTS